MPTFEIRFPDVTAVLTEVDSNVYSIIGTVEKALRRAGHRDEALEFRTAALTSESYDAVLQLCMKWVNVE